MKLFELGYLCAEPLLPPLMKLVRRRLRSLCGSYAATPNILDVGGRKSHYTIGVPAEVTITDLPRESDTQMKLNLGIDAQIIDNTLRRRTNVRRVLFDDMTRSTLPNETFDCVVAVEVLEHVEYDADFVNEVSRVLRPGGVFFLTTPNGDFVENRNPDHKRHYRRQQLAELLKLSFDEVEVEYAIRGGRYRRWGLKGWSLKQPSKTFLSMLGNVVNTLESSGPEIKTQSKGTHHLVATARKPSQSEQVHRSDHSTAVATERAS